MKRLSVLLSVVLFTVIALTTHFKAQSKDYFVGKWDVVVEGTPSGNAKGIVLLERKDGKLTGTFSAEGKPTAKINRVEEKEKNITIYFISGGYDAYLFLEKKDENNITGSMMDMFDAKGVRGQ